MLISDITEGTRCWKGYKKKGMKTMFGKRVPNCVKNEDMSQPNFDFEWGEAERYPFLAKLGKEGWIELANTGKTVFVNKDNVNQIGNTGADGGETFDDLDPDKVGRFKSAIAKGTVEMPIIIKMPNGQLELVAGNTRLIGLINKEGKAKVWYIDASKLNESVHPDKMTGNQMLSLLNQKHAWDEGMHVVELIHDVKSHNWALIDNYPLDKLGSVPDQYNRVLDTDDDYAMRDTDLSEPIVIASDRKTVIDGNHRVHKARGMGKTSLPAYFPMNIDENFADGKKKGKSRPGRVKRAGASCKGSVSSLRAKAKKHSGERGKMYHWCANMKGGKKK